MSKPKAKAKTTPEPDMSAVSGLTTAMMASNPALAKMWSDIMTEGARFVSERLKEDLEAQKTLIACKTPAEVVSFQSSFFLKAMQQYAEEAQRMSKIMTEASEAVTKDARQTWSRAYDDVPL